MVCGDKLVGRDVPQVGEGSHLAGSTEIRRAGLSPVERGRAKVRVPFIEDLGARKYWGPSKRCFGPSTNKGVASFQTAISSVFDWPIGSVGTMSRGHCSCIVSLGVK